jgi:hypothetical protein
MGNVLMGDLDGLTERLAFDTHDIEQIITSIRPGLSQEQMTMTIWNMMEEFIR